MQIPSTFRCRLLWDYDRIAIMDTMTLTINLPKDVGTAVEKKAKLSGRDSAEFIEDLVTREINRPSLDEILAPIRKNFADSGMSENDLDALIESERQAMWEEKIGTRG